MLSARQKTGGRLLGGKGQRKDLVQKEFMVVTESSQDVKNMCPKPLSTGRTSGKDKGPEHSKAQVAPDMGDRGPLQLFPGTPAQGVLGGGGRFEEHHQRDVQ